jgi:hypothetical protein
MTEGTVAKILDIDWDLTVKNRTKSYQDFDDQIQLALSHGLLNWVNYFIAGRGYPSEDFDLTTLNDNILLKKPEKQGTIKHWLTAIQQYISGSRNPKNIKTKQQDNLLGRLWKSANNANEKACSSHMVEFQLALEALFKSYKEVNETTPNTPTHFLRDLHLVYTCIATLNYYNKEKLPLDKAYEKYKHEIDTRTTFKEPDPTNHINIVIHKSNEKNNASNNKHHDYDDISDDERESVFSARPHPIFLRSSNKKRRKKNQKIEATNKTITNVMLAVLTRLDQSYKSSQSTAEIAKNNLQNHPYIARIFLLKQILKILEPFAYLPLMKHLDKSKTFPKFFSASFRRNLSLLDNKIFDYHFEHIQRKLLKNKGVVSETEQTKAIKQADRDAELLVTVLQTNNLGWITMHHALNRSIIFNSWTYRCAETLAISSAINTYDSMACPPSGQRGKQPKTQQNHLKITSNKHLTQLKKVRIFQDVATLSLFKCSDQSANKTLNLKYIVELNKHIKALCQKITVLSDAIHTSSPSEKVLRSSLAALKIPLSVMAKSAYQANDGTLTQVVDQHKTITNIYTLFQQNHSMIARSQNTQDSTDSFSDFSDEERELERTTPEDAFKNNVMTFLLHNIPSSAVCDNIKPSEPILLANSQPLRLTLTN